ncbi:MAG: class I SAM-dependent methyltransferase family protein [Candidatus Bathyarchaeota archaeon]|nr:class I SAM-dependent methyltransferase family protein [Candidatus Bathyarchaeota archaeon]
MNLKDRLTGFLEPSEIKMLYKSFDIVGDIAILKIPERLEGKGEVIAEALMQIHRNVKTVLCQVGPVSGDLRLRELRWLRGEKRFETIHKEHGCLFKVDLSKCYFSPRLSYERMRIARQVKSGEVIVNMFAGVGCFSIIIARHSGAKKVYSIDINPAAIHYMRENINLNRVENVVEAILGDSKEIILSRLTGAVDRVLMPLPEKAYEYLDYALMALKPTGGIIHYYDFEHTKKGEDPIANVADKVSKKLSDLGVAFNISLARIVRTVGPRWFQVALDIFISDRRDLCVGGGRGEEEVNGYIGMSNR